MLLVELVSLDYLGFVTRKYTCLLYYQCVIFVVKKIILTVGGQFEPLNLSLCMPVIAIEMSDLLRRLLGHL